MKEAQNKIKALAYIRYPSHAQDEGNSVAAQTTCIEAYAKAHNMEIEQYYIDKAKSGRNTNRPDYQRMKIDIENGRVESKMIVVRTIDRMHRNITNLLKDVEWCEKHGIRLIGVTDGTDTASGDSKLLLKVVAEEYSNTLENMRGNEE